MSFQLKRSKVRVRAKVTVAQCSLQLDGRPRNMSALGRVTARKSTCTLELVSLESAVVQVVAVPSRFGVSYSAVGRREPRCATGLVRQSSLRAMSE